MALEDMTVKEVMDAAERALETPEAEDGSRFQIAVLDRGFVYVGRVAIDKDWIIIRNARNIRYWGTTKGLGQLALEGPQGGTKLDEVGIVRVPRKALIHLIDTVEKSGDNPDA